MMATFQALGIQEFLESKDWLFVTLTAIIFILSTTVYYIYQKFRKAPSLQVGDVRNIGVAPL